MTEEQRIYLHIRPTFPIDNMIPKWINFEKYILYKEGRDIHYRYYQNDSDCIRCETGNNVC